MLYILLYILFTSIFMQVESARLLKKPHSSDCIRRPKLSKSTSTNSLNNKAKVIHANKTYSSSSQCNLTLPAPKVVINSYKLPLKNSVEPKPFGSIYLKCAACLAVAEQISQIINNTLEEAEIHFRTQDMLNSELSEKLQSLCKNGFKNYDLRKFRDMTLLTNKLKCTNHIESRMAGSWTTKLRELCKLYTSQMDMKHISNNYKNKINILDVDLCRGSGILRDCKNLDTKEFSRSLKDLKCDDVCTCEK